MMYDDTEDTGPRTHRDMATTLKEQREELVRVEDDPDYDEEEDDEEDDD